MSKRKKEKRNGFTLLEALVAMFVLLVGVLSVAGLHMFVASNNTTGNVATQAVLLAQSRIEKIKNNGDITTLNATLFPSENDITPVDGNGNAIADASTYTIDYRFCDPLDDIAGTSTYTAPTAFQGNMCAPGISAANFAACGSAPSCTNATTSTCLAAVRVSWSRGGGGRGGRGCVVMQTLTQGQGI
ncbi:MAG: hypothetical protein CSA26_05235 [Desulfobacterales bacterium]|nr:MAG: hypothetical protein CSA26_05235 [Desulfobacterales bacterium]